MFNLVHDYMKKLCHLPMFVVTQVFHLPEGLPREMARCAQIQRQVHATQRSYSHTFEPDPNQFGLATSHRILAFFAFLRFSRCDVCYQLTKQLSSTTPLDVKLAAISTYRQHLFDQYCDRSACWALADLSRDKSSSVLTVLLDGMDQSKFQIPRDPSLRQSSALALALHVLMLVKQPP